MELRHLRYFVAVADELHFGRAAERLFIAQPPLSQQIKALEKDLGVLLFHRTKRSVELSKAGEAFLEEAREVLARSEKAVQAAQRAQRNEAGHLAIGFVGSATYHSLPSVLRQFRERHPETEPSIVEMTTTQQVKALRAHRIDVGLIRPPVFDSELKTRTLCEAEFIAALPDAHPLAKRPHVDLAELRGEPFVMYRRQLDPGLYDPIVNACQDEGFSPNMIQEATQVHTILSLVSAGLGIALLPECARLLPWKGLTFLRVTPAIRTALALAWDPENRSAVVRSFLATRFCLDDWETEALSEPWQAQAAG